MQNWSPLMWSLLGSGLQKGHAGQGAVNAVVLQPGAGQWCGPLRKIDRVPGVEWPAVIAAGEGSQG